MSRILPVIERAYSYLAALPPAIDGEGGDVATFKAACAMVQGFALSEETALALLLSAYNPRCVPPWQPIDLIRKVRSAAVAAPAKPRGYLLGEFVIAPALYSPSKAAKWPQVDEARRHSIISAGPDTAELVDYSPLTYEVDDGSNAAEILAQLFATVAVPDPLLCIGRSNSVFATRPLSAWVKSESLARSSLVVPSPMIARVGRTKDGRESEHALSNTGARRFLVVEFDQGPANDHAALLWHLAGYGPLVLVVHSGGKSLHGWFYAYAQPEESMKRFMLYAASLGADAALFRNPSQFVRLPAGQRENGARQHILYFDPAAINRTEANEQ